jgi:putative tryptophan/tyrosine transport system ATP-binding protein
MLSIEHVSKTFRFGPDTVDAVRGVSLFLARGDFLTIIGSNGAGKSTLLNLISGVVPLTSGRIVLGGDDLSTAPAYRRARRISWIVQNPLAGTAPSMSVAENLALAASRRARTLRPAIPRALRREIHHRLGSLGVGLEQRLDCRVSLLSGGERQALAVVMATLVRPEVLLLDEHTAALDPRNAAMIIRMTCDFVESMELTTLMVTHNMAQALEVGNRLIMMHRGEVLHELAGEEKRRASVPQLVHYFADRDVVDDRLLLEAVQPR